MSAMDTDALEVVAENRHGNPPHQKEAAGPVRSTAELKPAILIYRDELLRPSETFIRQQAEALRRFTPYYVGAAVDPALPLPSDRVRLLHAGGPARRALDLAARALGLPPFGALRRVRPLAPQLLHAHFGPDGVAALPLARRLRIPLVVTFHGYDATTHDAFARRGPYRHRVYLRKRDALKLGASLFLAVSQFVKLRLLEQGFPPDRLLVHYTGVDLEAFRPALRTDKPIVLFVARLVEKKGCEHLRRAMNLVKTTRPDAELVVIGEGPLRDPLERLAASMLPRYRFLGRQEPEEVRLWMNRAAVLSVPSLSAASGDTEGLGQAFLEAQATGLPVVSYTSGGVPEAVLSEKTGFLVPEGDWGGLAHHLLLLLDNHELRGRFGEAGRIWVEQAFDLRRQTDQLEGIYAGLLAGSGGSP